MGAERACAVTRQTGQIPGEVGAGPASLCVLGGKLAGNAWLNQRA